VARPGTATAQATRVLGGYLRDVMAANLDARNFRVVGPDETASNRLDALFEVTGRTWMGQVEPGDDEYLSPDGRCSRSCPSTCARASLRATCSPGATAGSRATRRSSTIVDSMFNQHAKWLESCRKLEWRRPISSLTYLLTIARVAPGPQTASATRILVSIDHVVNKTADVIRIYLPPDANTLLSVADHCLRSRDYVNVIVAGKQPALQYLDMDAASSTAPRASASGSGPATTRAPSPTWSWHAAATSRTLENARRGRPPARVLPGPQVRVVNVVDLMTLQPDTEHPHGISDHEFDSLFTVDKPVIFAYHGYPWLVHRLTYRRHNHDGLHVRGYKEKGTTTTPFDMTVLNNLDASTWSMDVIDRVPQLGYRAAYGPPGHAGPPDRAPPLRQGPRRGHAGGPGVDLALLSGAITRRRSSGRAGGRFRARKHRCGAGCGRQRWVWTAGHRRGSRCARRRRPPVMGEGPGGAVRPEQVDASGSHDAAERPQAHDPVVS